jgi:hypothetical protein
VVKRLPQPHARAYQSVFGAYELERYVYGSREGQKLESIPLDVRLQLPESKFSSLLQDWDQSLAVEIPYTEVNKILQRILGLSVSVHSLERTNRSLGQSVESYWDNQVEVEPAQGAQLVVGTADGKGVVMRKSAEEKAVDEPNVSPGWRLLAPFLMLLFPLLLNFYPFRMEGQTLLLSILHMPLGMWLAFSLLRDSSVYRDADARLDFIRFSGEVTVYSVLIGLAAIALSVLGLALFSFVEVDIEEFLAGWVLPVILPGTLFAGIVLVERKRSLVENFAPILARIVSIPLLLILLTFGLFFIPRSGSLESAREILIAMDVLLLGVIVVVIYSISTRGDLAAGKTQDMVNLLLVLSAIVLDIFVLIAMVYRLAEYGMSANKLASLGSNILLLGNLSLLALYFISQLRSGLSAGKILSAQGWYFGLYAAWFYLVALGFPLIFRFA